MTDESKPVPQFKAPLLPATPLSAGAVGTFATALLAALAWIGQELVSLEKITGRLDKIWRCVAPHDGLRTSYERCVAVSNNNVS